MPSDLTPAPAQPVARDDTPMIVYVLYLAGFFNGITSVVGVIMAYVNKDGATPWAQTHYRFQIRTFWIGLLYGFVSVICLFILIGIPMLIFVAVWLIIRCAKGIKASSNGEPLPNVETWWW
jgi:uncharacterized membrane protein